MKMMSYMKDEDKGGFRGLENILESYQQGNSSQNSKAGRKYKHYADQSLTAQLILTEGLKEGDSQVM